MAQTVGSVLIDVKSDTSQLVKGMSQAERTIKQTTMNMKNAVKSLAVAYISFESISAFGSMVTQSINAADQMGELAEKFAISTEALSELSYAGKFAGVQLNTLTSAMGAMVRRTNNFTRSGGGAAATALKELGISAEYARENFTDTETTFKIIIERLSQLPDSYQRTAIAQDIFSKSAADVIRMANLGSDGIEALGEEARKTGNIISSEFAEQAGQLNEEVDALTLSLNGISNKLASKVVPHVLSAVRAFEKLLGIQRKLADFELEEKIITLQEKIKAKEETIKNAFSWNKGRYAAELRNLKMSLNYTKRELKLREDARKTLEKTQDINAGVLEEKKRKEAEEKLKKQMQSSLGSDETNHVDSYYQYMEKKEAALKSFDNAFARSQLTQTEYAQHQLAQQYLEYEKFVTDKIALDIWLESENQKILEDQKKNNKSWKDGVTDALDDYHKKATDTYTQVKDMFSRSMGSMEDALVDFARTGKLSFSSLADSIINDMLRMVIQQQITAPLAHAMGGLFAFEKGGIMTPEGAVPLRAYSTGGIATSPQLALYGEGSMNEAYVPLPDGQNIPVVMTGGGNGANVEINIENNTGNAISADKISEMTTTNQRGEQVHQINMVIDGIGRNLNGSRDTLKGLLK